MLMNYQQMTEKSQAAFEQAIIENIDGLLRIYQLMSSSKDYKAFSDKDFIKDDLRHSIKNPVKETLSSEA